jgi:hypothetical protein
MAPASNRPFCSAISADSGEPLAGTASRVDHWILLEYRGVWNPNAVDGSGLSDQVKAHLRSQTRALAPAKLLFVRRRERRREQPVALFHAIGGTVHLYALDAYEDLLALDLASAGGVGAAGPGERIDHPLFLVCTHGKHDRCCALQGRPVYDVLADQAEPGWVWQVSHVGGDRFAGNVVVLPEGLYYGRVRPEEAWTLLDEHLAGRIHLPRFRGRSALPFAVQAAEIAVRERYGLRSIPLHRAEFAQAGVRLTAAFGIDGRRFEVALRVEAGPLTYLTCDSERLSRPPRYAVESLRERAA